MNLTIKENEHQKWISEERFDFFMEVIWESLHQTGDLRLTAEYVTRECKTLEELFAVGYILGKGDAFFIEKQKPEND